MPKQITVQFTIPIDPDERRLGRSIKFRRWGPFSIEHGLQYQRGDFSCRYWADEKCVWFFKQFDTATAGEHDTILVRKLYATVTAVVDDTLTGVVEAMTRETNFSTDHLRTTYGAELLDRHDQFAADTYSVALTGYNRLVAHCRAEKGQYWLTEKEIEPRSPTQFLHSYEAKVRVGNSEWVEFRAAKTSVMGYWSYPENHGNVTYDDWKRLEKFVSEGRRPELVGTLLAMADEHRVEGHTRAALIESISALEAAVSNITPLTTAVWL